MESLPGVDGVEGDIDIRPLVDGSCDDAVSGAVDIDDGTSDSDTDEADNDGVDDAGAGAPPDVVAPGVPMGVLAVYDGTGAGFDTAAVDIVACGPPCVAAAVVPCDTEGVAPCDVTDAPETPDVCATAAVFPIDPAADTVSVPETRPDVVEGGIGLDAAVDDDDMEVILLCPDTDRMTIKNSVYRVNISYDKFNSK